MFALSSPGGVGAPEMLKVTQLALALDADVELFHCIFDPDVTREGRFGSHGAREDIQEFVARRREQLEHAAARLRSRSVRVRTSVRWDYPVYEGIVRQVLRHEPDLLIAQSTRKGRAARLALTQTDYRLIETCPCPILFIKTARPYSAPVIIAAVDPARSHEKPAGLDDAILDAGKAVCDALQGRLLVLHAGVSWEAAMRADDELQDVPEAVRDDVRGAYLNRMQAPLLQLAGRHGIRADAVRIIEGNAADLLPGVACHESADIMALGAVSRSRLRRALVGHTAERVLDRLNCDVLIAKPPGFCTSVRRGSTHHIPRSAAGAGWHVW